MAIELWALKREMETDEDHVTMRESSMKMWLKNCGKQIQFGLVFW